MREGQDRKKRGKESFIA